MSGLINICAYGNDSESETDECEISALTVTELKRSRLPVPNLTHVPAVITDQHFDDPQLHRGRKRTFPHMRGNWTTFVYVKYPDKESLLLFANKLKTLLDVKDSHICDDFHLSLTKTLVLSYHTITPFTQSLKETLSDIESFYLGFNSIEIFCNEERTRTFIAIKADYFSNKSLSGIVRKIDSVLEEFRLEKFYDDPSFHVSLLWINGDQKEKLEAILEKLNNVFSQEVGKIIKSIVINKLSEEAAEARNKHFRLYRQEFARKFSRENCNRDIFNRLLLTSDLLLSSMRSVKSRKLNSFLPETIALLMPANPNEPGNSSESEDEHLSEKI
ncbi:unnamed protein product [Parnassius apollo]|uniref:U6 snRNA phosphodiesterase n=1 Tax=Parnassius apollo TaxID=110799 RepID=A0A8S3W965_PARAO|nr:unnamed protein product [Parnassius apollo]